jgi:uncharacterized protein DUF2567
MGPAGLAPTGVGAPESRTRRAALRRLLAAAVDGARQDRRSALLAVLTLALAGLPAGLVWLWLAPRASYRVTATGVQPIGGPVSPELYMAGDGVYVLVLAALGVLAGIALWLLRRHRGVVLLLALAAGMIAASLVAWQLGQALGQGPSDQELTVAGNVVRTGVRPRSRSRSGRSPPSSPTWWPPR